jgi:thymidylate synthase
MWTTEFQSVDEAQVKVLDYLLTHGQTVSPRGMATLECEAVSFTVLDPRQRCVLNPARAWSLPLAIGETCWHLAGSKAAKDLAYYAPIWDSFADTEGQIRGSCYGSKIFLGNPSPWDSIISLLRTDINSRRAILFFNNELAHLDVSCKDAACAQSVQFMFRKGKLDAVVCMRSNDAIWGLPYDIFFFTFIQELLARTLGLEIGKYIHFAASLHIYKRHVGLAARVVGSASPRPFSMAPMSDIGELNDFLAGERGLRTSGSSSCCLGVYWQQLLTVLELFRQSRQLGWERVLELRPDSLYGEILRPLAEKRDTSDRRSETVGV